MTDLEIRNEALKVSPVIGANASVYLGFTLSDWMYIVTIIYMILQISWLILKMVTAFTDKRKNGKQGKRS